VHVCQNCYEWICPGFAVNLHRSAKCANFLIRLSSLRPSTSSFQLVSGINIWESPVTVGQYLFSFRGEIQLNHHQSIVKSISSRLSCTNGLRSNSHPDFERARSSFGQYRAASSKSGKIKSSYIGHPNTMKDRSCHARNI